MADGWKATDPWSNNAWYQRDDAP